jgi:hypothetical protein
MVTSKVMGPDEQKSAVKVRAFTGADDDYKVWKRAFTTMMAYKNLDQCVEIVTGELHVQMRLH